MHVEERGKVPEMINIGLIGGGRTGAPLIKELSGKNFVNIVVVADLFNDSAGMVFARENGIKTSNDPLEVARMGDKIDILIEVSGDPAVKPQIKQIFADTNNKHTIIVHDLVVRLIVSILKGEEELVESYHPEDRGIG